MTPLPPSASLASPIRIGCLAGWQVYDGATLEHYLHLLMSGVVAASREHGCELLLACGVGPPTRPYVFSPAWPELSPHGTFVPVGPWNCDGLIIVPPIHLPGGDAYARALRDTGFPVVFAGVNEVGPTIGIDNAAGVTSAVQHLAAHGHSAIAFIAGHNEAAGDSAERLHAFHAAMALAGLPVDPRLVVPGRHSVEQGEEAMSALLECGVPFSAVVASNDNSAFGALRALTRAGRRVPDDVALIGFDDLLGARVQTPPLTTVRQSPFDLGYQALVALLDLRAGQWDGRARRNIPVRLVIRQSCGCRPGIALGGHSAARPPRDTLATTAAQVMADALLGEARQRYTRELTAQCGMLADAFLEGLSGEAPARFQQTLVQALRTSEAFGEDAHIWHTAIIALQQLVPDLAGPAPAGLLAAERLVSWAHLTISERTRRQVTRVVLHQVDLADRVGTMTAQLLASLDETQIAATLREHLGRLGIGHLLVVLYEAEGDSPRAWCRIALSVGLPSLGQIQRFPTREFPPAALYPAETPARLAVLPLVIEGDTVGFAAFEAANLEPCAAIVRNLASALRTSRLYRDAAEGRRLAEEASQLKTRFLSMVSHELRTPLNVIVGLSEMLLRDAALGRAEGPIHADLERVYVSAQHLGQLIGDVLDLASSDAGQLRLAREPLDLSDVLHMVAAAGEQMARAKGLAWRADLPQPGPQILGDRTRLRQIVLNLVSNAVKFTERGSVTLILFQGQGRAVIAVRDTGMGIAPDEQDQIFDVFRRAGASVEQGYGGLGLGLAICKQLVELHGGQISVRSSGAPGEGATFSVEIPILEASATLAVRNLPQDLLVLADAGEPLAASLRAQGYAVRLLADAAELDSALAPPPGAILLDSPAATRHGPALSRLLQADPRFAHIPLLVWDASAAGGAVLELNLLSKPVSPGLLVRAVLRQDLDPGASHTVLVVDDTAALRALHTRIVGQALPGARVIEARDGREALALMERQLPDLVLLDLMMPELDGFGVLEAMRADPRTRAVPVLVLTARPLDDADIARLQHGVAAILAKGLFSVEETVGHITAALQRQRRLSRQTRRLMHRALAFIHERHAESLNRDLIAAHVGVNENYLSECFHAEMGVTPMAYLTRYRISRARALLEESEASITAIAAAVGFGDSAYFSRVFQREVGMSPREYRRRPRES